MFVVTGGAGFIGSNILKGLEEKFKGKELVVVDRLRDGEKWKNIAKRELSDIVHPDELFYFLEYNADKIEAIIHMGAISATTETDADKIITNNFSLSLDLWHWCADNKVRFIYASSAATYGDGSHGFNDDHSVSALKNLQPLNAYGWSKHLFDRKITREIERDNETPPQWVGLKFFNVYGPNEYHKGSMRSVINHIFPSAQKGEEFSLFKSHRPDYEDGEQSRDFVWVGDCVDIIMWMLDNPNVNGIFNVGTGKARSFRDLAIATYKALKQKPNITFRDTPENIRDKYQYFTQANMSNLRVAGYTKPATSLEDGVKTYVEILKRDDKYV
ncbi:MAG: ADP-glyceromanno-heptose 6-epimerase [Alphaproteobacteria bacterium]|nr:ADP-glyceromanno-heptose 6-epimerase [Alphaproteobacteria bacterium]